MLACLLQLLSFIIHCHLAPIFRSANDQCLNDGLRHPCLRFITSYLLQDHSTFVHLFMASLHGTGCTQFSCYEGKGCIGCQRRGSIVAAARTTLTINDTTAAPRYTNEKATAAARRLQTATATIGSDRSRSWRAKDEEQGLLRTQTFPVARIVQDCVVHQVFSCIFRRAKVEEAAPICCRYPMTHRRSHRPFSLWRARETRLSTRQTSGSRASRFTW